MKRVYLVHQWSWGPSDGWYPWLTKELESRGFQVSVPTMPDTNHPTIAAWVRHLEKIVQPSDDETYFIGHSIGCQAIARFIAKTRTPAAGVLFVAGWFTLMGLESEEEKSIAQPWMETPIDYRTFRSCVKKVVVLLSDDDPFVPIENAGLFRKNMGAKVIIEKGAGHFTGEETGVMEFPIILKTFLRLAHAD